MQRAEFEQLIQALYAARVSGNLEQLCALFAPHGVFEISGASGAKPIAIRTRGVDQYRPWLVLLLKTFRVTDHDLVTVIIDGSQAAVRWRASIHSKITGARVPTELVDLIEIEDGRITSYIEFFSGSMPEVR